MPDFRDPLAYPVLVAVAFYIVGSYLHWRHRPRK